MGKTINSGFDKGFDLIINSLLVFILLVVIYPLYFVIIASISDPDAINSGSVLFLPHGITFEGYIRIFEDKRILMGYRNTLVYTFVGTLLGVMSTLLAGYSLSRKDLVGRNWIMGIIIFTMYFNGGLIPTYMLVKSLGLTNTPWIIIILGSIGVYNIIITRTYFQSTISQELLEAAFIDGCTNEMFFLKIVLPLSKAITAVIALYYAVGHWNSFFSALIYLNDQKLYPLQLILRDILIKSQILQQSITDNDTIGKQERIAESIKYGVVIISSLPVIMIYPFIQKYFVKGVMIGSVKG